MVNYFRPGIGDRSRVDSVGWSLIAGRLPGRTDNEIKNHWHTNLLKKLKAAESNQNPKSTPKRTIKSVTKNKYYRQNKEERRQRQMVKFNKDSITSLQQQQQEEEEEEEKREPANMEVVVVVEKIHQVHIPKPIRLPLGYSYTTSSQISSSSCDEEVHDKKKEEDDKIEEDQNDEIYEKIQLFDELLNGCDNNISIDQCLEANGTLTIC
ncbi:hypothetical protein HAX54_006941 [Datura stramonium]|uniref:Uncharacterized protein n=1 Tax=Datura stramonium TaxID=4076 RepID=A0ABS8TAY2_DATST|nr:hypothetical protein [Datura stramonium]